MGKVREVARLEMYESAEYMQMHHIPLEVGDIFKKGDSKQHYMLLEQPCDLMVRGSVKNKGKRLVESVTLAEIFYVKVEADGKVKAPNASTKLEYYSTEAGKEAFVRLEKCITVPVCILDLCVCGDDGKAKLEVGKACPEGMIPAWQERYKILQAKASQLLIQYQGLIKPQGKEVPVTPAIKQALQANLLQSVPGLVTGSIDLDAKRIEYAIQRVGKLRQPWAGGVLRDYAYHKARDAFDHDWTRTEKQ